MDYDDLSEIMKVIDREESESAGWNNLPENILIKIFKYLTYKEIISCSGCCKRWNTIGIDCDLLWKFKLQNDFKIQKNIPRKPGESSAANWFSFT